MAWSFKSDKPIFLQIEDIIRLKIISGEYSAGQRLPAVRDLSLDAGVNPNTLQRAFRDLETEGLVHSQRTSGRFITNDIDLINRQRFKAASAFTGEYCAKMKELGFSDDEILTNVKNTLYSKGEA